MRRSSPPGRASSRCLLEVKSTSGDPIGETIYTHLVLEPSEFDASGDESTD